MRAHTQTARTTTAVPSFIHAWQAAHVHGGASPHRRPLLGLHDQGAVAAASQLLALGACGCTAWLNVSAS